MIINRLVLLLFVLCLYPNISHADSLNDWILRNHDSSCYLSGVALGNNLFGALGKYGVILTSTDCVERANRIQSPDINYSLNSATFGNSMFVTVGANGIVSSKRTILQTTSPCNCIPYFSSDLTLHLPRINAGNVSLAANLQYVQDENGEWLFKLMEAALENQCNCVNAAKLFQEGGSYRLHVPSIPIGETAYRVDLEYVPTTDGSIWFRLFNVDTTLGISEIASVEVTGTDTPLSVVVTDKDRKEALGILTDKDLQGNPQRITGVVYTSAEGVTFLVRIGVDGLPYSMEDTLGDTFKFSNYTHNTVDVKVYSGNGTSVGGPFTVPVDEYQLSQLKELVDTFTSLSTSSFSTNVQISSLSDWQIQQLIKAGSLSVGIVSCGVTLGGIVGALGTGGVLTPVVVAGLTGCVSTIVSAYAYFSQQDLNAISSGTTHGALCLASLLNPEDIPASCVSLLADIAVALSGTTGIDIVGVWNFFKGCCDCGYRYTWHFYSDGTCQFFDANNDPTFMTGFWSLNGSQITVIYPKHYNQTFTGTINAEGTHMEGMITWDLDDYTEAWCAYR